MEAARNAAAASQVDVAEVPLEQFDFLSNLLNQNPKPPASRLIGDDASVEYLRLTLGIGPYMLANDAPRVAVLGLAAQFAPYVTGVALTKQSPLKHGLQITSTWISERSLYDAQVLHEIEETAEVSLLYRERPALPSEEERSGPR